jgi:hypothetical protein
METPITDLARHRIVSKSAIINFQGLGGLNSFGPKQRIQKVENWIQVY